jgi:hypothetical protein
MEVTNITNAIVLFIGVLTIPGFIIYTYKKNKWNGYEVKIKKEIKLNEEILENQRKVLTAA